MKIDFEYKFKKLNGEVIPEQPDKIIVKDGQKTEKIYPPFTLRILCENVLLKAGLDVVVCPQCRTVIKRPRKLSGKKKVKRAKLAKRIHDSNGPVDVGASDIRLLRRLIAKNYPALTVAQAWGIFENLKIGVDVSWEKN
ncbi:unnamed protein product [marine sediment metagenome]|uniref:Uncharacterized protein n=1 Tax=marine sediment metagenome TaxID=412755 RepID=X1EMR6_9ZZZZ